MQHWLTQGDTSYEIRYDPGNGYAFSTINISTDINLSSQESTVVKTGKKPIVIRKSQIQQVEHDDKDAAIAEASRLATKEQDEFVVYVPVAVVRPKAEVTIDTL